MDKKPIKENSESFKMFEDVFLRFYKAYMIWI